MEHLTRRHGKTTGASLMRTIRALVNTARMRLNATYENAPMQVLVEDMVREMAAMGRFGILLDFPADGATAKTVPHISTFRAENIEDFETGFVRGRKVLTRVHLASDEDWEGADVTYELILEAGVYQFRRFVRDPVSK